MVSWKNIVCTTAVAIGLSALSVHGQVVAFDVNNEGAGVCATATTALNPNVSNPMLCRGLGVAFVTTANAYNSNGWTLAGTEADAIAANDFVAASFVVGAGFNANITDLVANLQRSNTGPQMVFVRSSVDAFATTLASGAPPTALAPVTFDIPDITGAAGTIEFRFYGFGAGTTGGTLRFQDGAVPSLSINGSVQTGGGGDPQGACCFANGSCQFITAAQCSTAGGVYQGNAVTCVQAGCPAPIGACCVNGFCTGDVSQAECLATPGATWGGDGTSCGTFVCPIPLGRCCLPNNTCVEMISAADCGAQGGTGWVLNGFCDNFICTPTTGACCLPDQTCVIAEAADCTVQSGVYMGRGIACGSVSCAPATGANLVAKYDFDVNRVGIGRNLSFTLLPTGPFTSAGDGWGVYQRFFSASVPFTLLDDSLSIFELDTLGIVSEAKLDKWFGTNDLQNPDNLSGAGTATWVFDIVGFTNLSISLDMAAMGDFEAAATMTSVADSYVIAASIDAGSPQALFTMTVDEADSLVYTMAGGALVTLDDPLMVNGSTVLNNVFRNFVAAITGTGNALTITLTVTNDSDEAFTFDNIMIMGDTAGPATGACCLTNGTCAVQTSADCAIAGGSYLGDGQACVQATCNALNVACCINGTCSVVSLEACNFQENSTVDSFGASCSGVTCPAVFCDADWCQDGVVGVPDIFCFLSDWFANDPIARNYGGTNGVPAIFAFLSIWFATGIGPCP